MPRNLESPFALHVIIFMALVDYASSDDDLNLKSISSQSTADPHTAPQKRKVNNVATDLPPLPSKFHDLYASSTRLSTNDDPCLHYGKKRSCPHIVGNWPSHIYIEWHPSTTERETLNKLISEIEAGDCTHGIKTLLASDLNSPLPLHISLSRPIQITTDEKELFMTSLRRSFESSGVPPFQISFKNLAWVANSERSRWFLVMRVSWPDGDELQRLLNISNATVRKIGQLPLYSSADLTFHSQSHDKRSSNQKVRSFERREHLDVINSTKHECDSDAFHVSIAWKLSPPSQDLLECTELVSIKNIQHISQFLLHIEKIKVKIGNAVTVIPLLKCVNESRGSLLN
ncbi:U6 snRNA phosphodiesterase [Golovinomyces cichoracearum]|uniref:U6 snRNA phosphodiesterase n=1 Tax=Golovinomyces cichoracearum TaxID=62708 RepID=A0A420J7A0_9PEZI|nr:U6 snRNA phosphodiesterase [Golovinomyces cichoracearum]